MLNWEEEVAPALAKAGLAQQPVVAEPQRPQAEQLQVQLYRVAQRCASMLLISV
jgi:hypothetical protein